MIPTIPNDDNFYFTTAGRIIPTVTGGTSAMFSALVLYLILRSKSKLKSAYHRIMTLMSTFDFFSSIAIALTTLPMPKDHIYPYSGKSFGNITTCNIQGFVYVCGAAGVNCSLSTLCLYYLMTIRYGMDEKKSREFLEPAAYTVGFIITLAFPLSFCFMNWYNPIPFVPHCSLGPYPFECSRDEDVECIRGGVKDGTFRASGFFLIIGITAHLIIVTTCMTLVILSVMKAEKRAENISITTGSTGSTPGTGLHNNINNANASIEIRDDTTSVGAGRTSQAEEKDLHLDLDLEQWNEENISAYVLELANRREKIVGQATMYVGAFILTWTFTVISFFNETSKFIMAAKLIFQPSRGLFNSLIFVYHKVDNVRRSDDNELSVWEALKVTILRPQDVTEIFINVDVVFDDLLASHLEMLHLPHQQQTGRDIQSAQYLADQDDISSSKVSWTSEKEEGVSSMEGISIDPSTRSSRNRLDSLKSFFSSTRDQISSFGGRSIEGPTVTSTATTIKH